MLKYLYELEYSSITKAFPNITVQIIRFLVPQFSIPQYSNSFQIYYLEL